MKLFIFSLFITLILFNNCSGDKNKSNDVLTIGELKIQCLHLSAKDCQKSTENSLIFIGLINTKKTNCEDLLTSTIMSNLYNSFDASAIMQVNFDSGLRSLTAGFDNWVSDDGINIQSLNNTEYLACSFIDTNGDGLLNRFEPILEQNISLQDTQVLTLENWTNY